MPSWLPVALTIADFVVQRVDRVGPVSFEPPEKQPPERAQTAVPTTPKKTKATSAADVQGSEMGSTSDTENSSGIGFRAGGTVEPGGGDVDNGGGSGGGSGGEDDDDGNERRCSFRSMRVKDRPTTYEV